MPKEYLTLKQLKRRTSKPARFARKAASFGKKVGAKIAEGVKKSAPKIKEVGRRMARGAKLTAQDISKAGKKTGSGMKKLDKYKKAESIGDIFAIASGKKITKKRARKTNGYDSFLGEM